MGALATGVASFGTLIMVGDGTSPQSFYRIAGVGNISGPSTSVDEAETTSHSTLSPHRTFIPTLIDDGEISFTVNYDPSHNTHEGGTFSLGYLFQNRVRRAFQLQVNQPSGVKFARHFDAFVKDFGETYELDGINTKDVTLRIVTAPASVTPAASAN